MRLGAWAFTPRRVPTLATLVLLPLLIALGFWQLDRGAGKSALAAAHAQRADAPAVPLTSLPRDPQAARYRRAEVSGRYDGDGQILHAYQMHEGRLGFNVYTPFALTGADQPRHLLVNRGWVPHGRSRLDVPPLPVPAGEITLRGTVDQFPSVGLRLGAPDDGRREWPRVVQYLDPPHLEAALERRLRPVVLRLADSAPGALQSNWTLFHVGPERNYGYAVQWFALALALLVIYIGVNTHRLREPTMKG